MQYKIVTNENIDKLVDYISSKGYVINKKWFNYYLELDYDDSLNTINTVEALGQLSRLEMDIGRSVSIHNKEVYISEPNYKNL